MSDKDLKEVCRASDALADTVHSVNLLHKQAEHSGEARVVFLSSELATAAHREMEALETRLDQAASLAETVELLDKATAVIVRVRDRMVDGLAATVPVPDRPPVD